ncbi:MAG: hypothetical protein IPF41_06350 [Flavobacteriales bacterium]|nr:hypothetical protein [Flavobacteriales bacterium]
MATPHRQRRVDANCNCAGQLIDCLGARHCAGRNGLRRRQRAHRQRHLRCQLQLRWQLIDCLGVPGGSALVGTACDDGNALTGNDVYDANCICAGQLIDCLGVPGGTALVGTACDDGNPQHRQRHV